VSLSKLLISGKYDDFWLVELIARRFFRPTCWPIVSVCSAFLVQYCRHVGFAPFYVFFPSYSFYFCMFLPMTFALTCLLRTHSPYVTHTLTKGCILGEFSFSQGSFTVFHLRKFVLAKKCDEIKSVFW
jgi:hypothetical protein